MAQQGQGAAEGPDPRPGCVAGMAYYRIGIKLLFW